MNRALRVLVVLAGLFVVGLPVWCMVSCTPPTPAQNAKLAQDLCILRGVERAILHLDPSLSPPPDTLRAKLQETEDQLCAELEDAGAPPAPE